MIELYEFAASGNCHKVRLLLSLLKLPYQSVLVNGAEKQHKSADFLAMNGFGQVPVLRDGDTVIRDSQAILVYLARQCGGEQWLPNDAANLAEVCSWLSTAANEVSRGPNALRQLAADAGLVVECIEGAVFYPPVAWLARVMAPLDRWLGRHILFGAAFLVVAANNTNRPNHRPLPIPWPRSTEYVLAPP